MRILTDYRFLPLSGGGVVVKGLLEGKPWITTRVMLARDGEVLTQSGSTYTLRNRSPGIWEVQLQVKRPQEFSNLQAKGLVG